MRTVVVTEGGTELIAWGSFALALCAFAFSVYWSRRTERRLSLDEYWFRQIVAPKCVSPIIEFHDYWLAELSKIESATLNIKLYRQTIGTLQTQKSALENSVWIVRMFSPDFQQSCYKELEGLEDAFASKLGAVVLNGADMDEACSALRQHVSESAVTLLSRAAHIHGNALKPRGKLGTSWLKRLLSRG